MANFKPGDRILVAWGRDKVAGRVLSLFGGPGEQYARLQLEFPGDDDEPEFKLLTLPVNWLIRASAA